MNTQIKRKPFPRSAIFGLFFWPVLPAVLLLVSWIFEDPGAGLAGLLIGLGAARLVLEGVFAEIFEWRRQCREDQRSDISAV